MSEDVAEYLRHRREERYRLTLECLTAADHLAGHVECSNVAVLVTKRYRVARQRLEAFEAEPLPPWLRVAGVREPVG